MDKIILPIIMAALSLAKNKAQSEQNQINQLNQNRMPMNTTTTPQQPMQSNPLPQQSNGIGNAVSLFSQLYGGFGK